MAEFLVTFGPRTRIAKELSGLLIIYLDDDGWRPLPKEVKENITVPVSKQDTMKTLTSFAMSTNQEQLKDLPSSLKFAFNNPNTKVYNLNFKKIEVTLHLINRGSESPTVAKLNGTYAPEIDPNTSGLREVRFISGHFLKNGNYEQKIYTLPKQ